MASAADNEATIRTFYEAFQNKDAKKMGEQYADNATFHDPAFRHLNVEEARAMWTMLLHRGKDLTLEFSEVSATETEGKAIWDAKYTFSASGRMVNNHIQATFKFVDGKIVSHVDDFDIKLWMKMAMGFMGTMLGMFAFGRNAVHNKAKAQLVSWMKRDAK